MTNRREWLVGTTAIIAGACLPGLTLGQGVSALTPDSIDRESFFTIENGTAYLTGVDVELTSANVPGNTQAFVVRADTVRISQRLVLPGMNVTILARQIIIGAGGQIVTAGNHADASWPNQRATDGINPGDPGKTGRDGGPGGNGGHVLLYAQAFTGEVFIDARGATGGVAEGGGFGAPGQNGANWHRGMNAGGNGTPGGQPGAPGKPGKGGDGGNVVVYTLSAVNPPPRVTVNAGGGSAGSVGVPGKSGVGGNAGNGGSDIFDRLGPCPVL